ncbi:MAG: alpha/beta fold hydrolase [Cyclobacteriaceae bacterium]|nr:alpha/beta fold hydrolase [Cyclobacteriaceae bacterium]
MPIVKSNYKSPFLYFNHHLETIIPALFRIVTDVYYERERIYTPDDDFLDLDWVKNNNNKLVIICHGLEGSSDRPYMMGMAKIFANNSFDVLTWNFRGCSGEVNWQPRAYHSGATEDLQAVVQHAINQGYNNISLIGFSLGGNLVLKYIGENGNKLDKRIKKGVGISVPLHLHSSCIEISKFHNIMYEKRFLQNLKKKVKIKSHIMPNALSTNGISKVNTIIDFDDKYTAPIHGYKNALDYYEQCSSVNFLESISIPTLIINAKNDSFLSKECYPIEIAKTHQYVYLEMPEKGGHCGFPSKNKDGYYWSEQRVLSFINANL